LVTLAVQFATAFGCPWPLLLLLGLAKANAGIAVANIMAAMTSATVTNNMMRLIISAQPPLPKDGASPSPGVFYNATTVSSSGY
jgi:hypothetical protein